MPGKYSHLPPIRERKRPHYRFRDMLHALGTDAEIHKLIEAYGYDAPSPTVIRGWRTRNAVPAKWLPLFMNHLMNDGIKPADLLVDQ